jgi:Serine acetyltransferase, N-terminal
VGGQHGLRLQDEEPVLASHLHSSVIMHGSLEESLAFVLANKLSSPTLLATNLMQLIIKAYIRDPVHMRPALCVCHHHAGSVSCTSGPCQSDGKWHHDVLPARILQVSVSDG